MTFEQYIEDHSSSQMRAYLTGYADAIHNNAYFFGSCPKRLQYRPYSEYMQHIDIYIAQKTKDDGTNREIFLQKNVEPFLTEVILKYIDCDNPESIPLQDESKLVQTEIRSVARDILQKTKKYQTIDEREMEFQYNEYLERLKTPTKEEKEAHILHAKQNAKKTTSSKDISKPIAERLRQQSEAKKIETSDEIAAEAKAKINENSDEQEDTGRGVIDALKDKLSELPFIHKEKKVEKQIERKVEKSTEKVTEVSTEKLSEKVVDKVIEKQDTKVEKTIDNSAGYPKVDLSVPELKIPEKSTPQKIETVKIQTQEYKLDSMDINLDNLNNAKLPSI